MVFQKEGKLLPSISKDIALNQNFRAETLKSSIDHLHEEVLILYYEGNSFLMQHSDEEAVLKSFKDINELIKDMLELKAKYASVETELKEMHDLSLQFAVVQGETCTKTHHDTENIRTPKKPGYLNRSSSDTLWDQ
ncbi:hypothetical protein POM88_011416 [Heracleum sosnowskyi]|uniref:Uncharacterized protein n=1 Tax=Heracleum sosnowskyi TaxID=360622 RepID=A0AAD8IUW2_9APIA|nr:hypothetical protein POM88_011416 [Heracleum sosnowskyi]